MAIVWYVLIHVSLALIGYQVFTFTNLGAFYAAMAGAVVQGYSIWEVHRVAKPRFESAFIGKPGPDQADQGYIGDCYLIAADGWKAETSRILEPNKSGKQKNPQKIPFFSFKTSLAKIL